MCVCVCVCHVYVTKRDIFCHTYISELDEGINPNSFPYKRYGQVDHIGSTWGSSSPSQESGTSSKVRKCSWWMPNLTFSILKIERRVIHQIVCILKDKSIGVLKITYGHHPWGQEGPPCIRKSISGTFLISYFLDILYVSIVCQNVCTFQDKSNGDD